MPRACATRSGGFRDKWGINARGGTSPPLFCLGIYQGLFPFIMRTFLSLMVVLLSVLPTVSTHAQVGSAYLNSSKNTVASSDAAGEMAPTAQVKNTQTFEQQLIGSIWNFPWGGHKSFIKFLPDGKLEIGWNIHYKGYKWSVPQTGTVELHVYMDGRTIDTLRIPPNLISAALTRGGKQVAIISRRY